MKKLLICLCLCVCFSVQAAFPRGSSASGAGSSPQPSAAEILGSAQSRSNEAMANMDRALTDIDSELTLEDQYYLGRAVAANILAVYRLYTENPALTRYLNLICQAILINSPEIELFNGCYVGILDSPEFNAFASPGGHIYITKGLVEATVSEDMLAAVIAHELAHIKLKHGMKMIEDMRFFYDMNAIANRGFDFSRDSQGAQRLMEFRGSVTTMLNALLRSGYSQAQEFEADREAAALMAAAGYDPEALLAVFKVLYDAQNSSGIYLNTTHPSALERTIQLDRWLVQYRVQDTRRYRAVRFMNH